MLITMYDRAQAPMLVGNIENRVVYSRLGGFQNVRQHQGISLKYVIDGEESYEIGRKRFTVRPGQYLLVNHQTEIYTEIAKGKIAEGICVYFKPQLLKEVAQALYNGNKGLLEGPVGQTSTVPDFHEQVYDDALHRPGTWLRKLSNTLIMNNIHPQLDEPFYYELGAELLFDQREIRKSLERLDCVKASTRIELFRRLSLARSFIHDNLSKEIDLDMLSREACLSKFHFLRLFKQAFGMTPHQYLIKLRLQKARRLLVETTFSLAEICQEIGLKDLSSFGRRFKKTYGYNPSEYRRSFN